MRRDEMKGKIDELKGKVNDLKGRVERQAGEWTGDTEAQIKGAGDQLKGKMQKGIGKVKGAGSKMMQDIRDRDHKPAVEEHEEKRGERKVA